jgi:hypothetical protein
VTRRIEANYSESYLFPPALEDWVGEDHPARVIRAVVEELDLDELGLGGGEDAGQGRPHYSAELLLKAWCGKGGTRVGTAGRSGDINVKDSGSVRWRSNAVPGGEVARSTLVRIGERLTIKGSDSVEGWRKTS